MPIETAQKIYYKAKKDAGIRLNSNKKIRCMGLVIFSVRPKNT